LDGSTVGLGSLACGGSAASSRIGRPSPPASLQQTRSGSKVEGSSLPRRREAPKLVEEALDEHDVIALFFR
jgi:hypothetical protein